MKSNIYINIIKFIFNHKIKIILILLIPQLIIFTYTNYFAKSNCFIVAKYKISETVSSKAALRELYLKILDLDELGIQNKNEQFIIKNTNIDYCKKQFKIIEKKTIKFNNEVKNFIFENLIGRSPISKRTDKILNRNSSLIIKTDPILLFDFLTYEKIILI